MPEITGSPSDDILNGTPQDDVIRGLAGDDILRGDGGADTLDGGAGTDTARYDTAAGGVTVDLRVVQAQAVGGGAGNDTLTSIENLSGSAFDDVLTGTDGGFGSRFRLVSRTPGGSGQGVYVSAASYSPDGTRIVFTSDASTLVPGDTNRRSDIFVTDLRTGAISRISITSTGGQGDAASWYGVFSPDGDSLLISSSASLIAGFEPDGQALYLTDLRTGVVALVADKITDLGEGGASAFFSPDSAKVVFCTYAALTSDDHFGGVDVYMKDLASGQVTLLSVDGQGHSFGQAAIAPRLSADGRLVLFKIASDQNDPEAAVYVRDLTTGVVTRVDTEANGPAFFAEFTPDSRSVIFVSRATNLIPGIPASDYPNNGGGALFQRDLLTGAVTLLSVGLNGKPAWVIEPAVSPDGRLVAFISYDPNLPGANGYEYRLFVVDRTTGVITKVANGDFHDVEWSPDGQSLVVVSSTSLTPDDRGGTDIYTVVLDGDNLQVSPDNTLSGGDGDDVLRGLGGNDLLAGDAGNDRLEGGAGNDGLDGGSGADRMEGGTGDDTYGVENVGDVVIEAAGGGVDTVKTNLTGYVLGADVENLILVGTADLNGTGNSLNNVLTGNSGGNLLEGGKGDDALFGGNGDDVLIGGTGDDVLTGGSGNDFYYATGSDRIVETADGGHDTVYALSDFLLAVNVEDVVLLSTDRDDLKGNALGNRMTGNDQANWIKGEGGDDVLMGLGGSDVLVGGMGRDVMDGGRGADAFRFVAIGESRADSADLILHFSKTDRLDLSALDADTVHGGRQAAHQVAAFSGQAGEMTVAFDGTDTWVRIDADGDGQADFALQIQAVDATDTTGWLL